MNTDEVSFFPKPAVINKFHKKSIRKPLAFGDSVKLGNKGLIAPTI